jgi:DNA polymerase-3 subunit delta'
MTPHPWNLPLWRTLEAERGRMPHAILLHGPLGVGKKVFAQALAKSMLCETPTAEGACGRCKSCHWFDQGSHPDYKLIEPAEKSEDDDAPAKKGGRPIAIAEIRALGEFLALAAHQGGWRVVVLHPAEAMNVAAANALLKTLEEPPDNVLLLLVSHQPRRLLPTVLSRCRKVAVALPDRLLAIDWLRQQGQAEPDVLLREAGGAPLVALEYADAERLARRKRFVDVLAAPSASELSSLGQEFQHRLDEAWGWLARWAHDLLRIRNHAEARYFPEHDATLARLAEAASLSGLLQLEQDLRLAGRWLRHPLNGQLLLESWLLRYGEITRAKNTRLRHG